MKDKVMITGGAGFIGSRLVLRLLNDGYQVHVFDMTPFEKALRLKNIKDNKNLKYTQGDLRDKNKIKEWYQKDASHLFHLASVVGVENYINDPLALIDIVVGGTRNLFELAAKFKTRVLFTSTSEIYGKNPNIPWGENSDRFLGPTSIDRWSYSSSKAVCEHMLFALEKSHQLKFSIIRFFNVYGPGQAPIFVVSKSIYQALNNKSPLIYDDGLQTRCFTFVDDAIEGLIKASFKKEGLSEVFNIGSNIETSMKEVVNLVIKFSGDKIQPENFITQKEYGKSYEDIPRRIPNVSKAKNILNWEATTKLADGIRTSIEWAKFNKWWLE